METNDIIHFNVELILKVNGIEPQEKVEKITEEIVTMLTESYTIREIEK